jgi:hypothetical protein
MSLLGGGLTAPLPNLPPGMAPAKPALEQSAHIRERRAAS